MTIHDTHPFAEPPDPVRRFRGRLGGAVSLWTAGSGASRAGLTVTSLMVANGEPARVLGLLDPDSDLCLALEESGRGVVQLLEWGHRQLADAFAGTAPAPGGAFAAASWEQTTHGPRLSSAASWVLVSLESLADVGWSTLATCRVEEVVVGEEREPLSHRRGRYQRPDGFPG